MLVPTSSWLTLRGKHELHSTNKLHALFKDDAAHLLSCGSDLEEQDLEGSVGMVTRRKRENLDTMSEDSPTGLVYKPAV